MGVGNHQRCYPETVNVRAVIYDDVQAREWAWRRHLDEQTLLKLSGKSDVIVVEPKRMADLMGRERQQVDAPGSGGGRFAEHSPNVELSILHICSIRRIAQVFGVVGWGRIGEETGDAPVGRWPRGVVKQDARPRNADWIAALRQTYFSPVLAAERSPAVLDRYSPIAT